MQNFSNKFLRIRHHVDVLSLRPSEADLPSNVLAKDGNELVLIKVLKYEERFVFPGLFLPKFIKRN